MIYMASCDYTVFIKLSAAESFLDPSCLQSKRVHMKWSRATRLNMPCPVLPSVAVRVEPLGLCVCILSGIEPGQLVEGPGASLSSEVEA